MTRVIVLFIFFTYTVNGANLPSYFKKCYFNDPNLSKCLTESAQIGWPTLADGDKSIHFHPADPTFVPSIFINMEGNLQLNMSDVNIYGLKNINLKKVNIDFTEKQMDISYDLISTTLLGTYSIRGNMLIFQIDGSGPINVTYVNGNYTNIFNFKIIEKNNKHYINIIKSSMFCDVEKIYFKLGKIIRGREQMAKLMQHILDENWQEVNDEIGKDLCNALGEILKSGLTAMFQKLSLEDLFLDYTQ